MKEFARVSGKSTPFADYLLSALAILTMPLKWRAAEYESAPFDRHGHMLNLSDEASKSSSKGGRMMIFGPSHFVTRTISTYRTRADERSWRKAAYRSWSNRTYAWLIQVVFMIGFGIHRLPFSSDTTAFGDNAKRT